MGFVDVLENDLLHGLGEDGVVDGDVGLGVAAHGAVGEVDRADGGPDLVDDHGLGVEHACLVFEDLDAALEQFAVMEPGGAQDRVDVDVGAGDDHAHIDAALGGRHQGPADLAVGNKIGVLDPDAFAGGLDGHVEEKLGHGTLVAARGGDDLGLHGAGGVDLGELGLAVEDFAGGVHPVLQKDALQLGGHGALHAGGQIAPFIGVAGVAFPALVEAKPADVANPAVDDDDLAVGAVAGLVKGVEPDRLVDAELDARGLHLVLQAAEARAQAVDQDADFDPRSRPLGQGGGKEPADGVPGEDVEFDVDAVAGVGDGGEDVVEVGVAVFQQGDFIARPDAGAEGLEGLKELRVLDPVSGGVGVGHPLGAEAAGG